MQREVVDRVEGLVSCQQPTAPIPAPEAALAELLHFRSPYQSGSGSVNLASYQSELVSLPEDVRKCPSVGAVTPDEARQYLEENGQRMLKTETEYQREIAEKPLAKAYWDQKLKTRRHYRALVLRLHRIGMLRFTLDPREFVGVFTAWKSGRQKHRLIVDAGRPNRRFRDPPRCESVHRGRILPNGG
jgi:hypothetical protein